MELDPKIDDLFIDRLKIVLIELLEGRTRVCRKILSGLVNSGEMPIEFIYSWFSVKVI